VGKFIDVVALHEAKDNLSKLTPKERKTVNAALRKAGLDGNTVFRSPNAGLMAVTGVMSKHGFEYTDYGGFKPDSGGTKRIDFERSNKADPFSPTSIANSIIWFSWYRHRETSYECIAYLS